MFLLRHGMFGHGMSFIHFVGVRWVVLLICEIYGQKMTSIQFYGMS